MPNTLPAVSAPLGYTRARAPKHHAMPAAAHAIPGAGAVALLDTAAALLVLAVVVLAPAVQAEPGGLDQALAIRITLKNALLIALLAWGWPVVFWAWGLYDADGVRTPVTERVGVAGACGTATLAACMAIALWGRGDPPAVAAAYFWVGSTAAVIAVREIRRIASAGPLRRQSRRVLMLGTGPRAVQMWRRLARDRSTTYTLAGFVDTPGNVPAHAEFGPQPLGSLDELETTLIDHTIDDVCIALPIKSHYHEIQQALHVCERIGVRTRYAADLFQSDLAWPRYDGADSPTVTMHVVVDDHRLVIKRLFDVIAAAAGLIVLSPLLLAVCAAIKLTSPGPVLFTQQRYGFNRRQFRMFKFRTMVPDAERLQAALETANEADGPVFKIARDPRVTAVGRFLRRTSIDELPQLLNVLRGDMSLVGPRPLPLRDVGRFTRASDMRRFSVQPGLTCLWQISGRSSLSFGDWVALDLQYIDAWSLRLDAAILVKTIPAVLRGTGAQ